MLKNILSENDISWEIACVSYSHHDALRRDAYWNALRSCCGHEHFCLRKNLVGAMFSCGRGASRRRSTAERWNESNGSKRE